MSDIGHSEAYKTCSTDALPVHYVFPRRKLDISEVVQRLRSISEDDFLPGDPAKKGLVVVWDVAFDWLASELCRCLSWVGQRLTGYGYDRLAH